MVVPFAPAPTVIVIYFGSGSGGIGTSISSTVHPRGIPLGEFIKYSTPYSLTNVPVEATPDNQSFSASVAVISVARHFI